MGRFFGAMMNVWIGHYKGNPSEWFLVWAETEDDAFLLMDGMEGEPDRRSMRVLNNEGLVNFSAKLATESGETYAEVVPSTLVLMEEDNDHVVELVREPLDDAEDLE